MNNMENDYRTDKLPVYIHFCNALYPKAFTVNPSMLKSSCIVFREQQGCK